MDKAYVILYKTTEGVDGVALIAHKNRSDAEAAARELKQRDYILPTSVKIVVVGVR